MMYYEEVFRALNRQRVKYVVVGGVAVVLHGVVRFTADLDLIIDMSPSNIDRLWSALEALHYRPKVPVKVSEFQDAKLRRQWIEKKNMKVFSFFHVKDPLKTIDVLIDTPVSYQNAKKVIYRAKGVAIPTLGIDDLKKLKRKAARPQDLADIRSLEDVERIPTRRRKNG